MTALALDLETPLDLSRAEQRRLLASTAPAPRMLTPHAYEDLAVRKLMYEHPLVIRRLDDPTRTSSDLTEEHYGAIRLFDRGIIDLHSVTDTHAAWTWAGLNAEADGLRMLRHRTPGFLPYNMGHHGRNPKSMSGPELVALLVWHYRHTDVFRVDLTVSTPDEMRLAEHHADGSIDRTGFTPVFNITPFEDYTRRIHPHIDSSDQRLDPVAMNAVLTNLCRRVAMEAFGEARVTVDLNTWHLHPFGTQPSTFTESLPLDVQDALGTLDAPAFVTREECVDWARSHLRITVMCRTAGENASRCGGRKHTIRLDPDTGATETVQFGSDRQHQELQAVHLLAALSNEYDPRCVLVGQAWDTDGLALDTPGVRWTQLQFERVLACYRVAEVLRTTA